MTGWEGGCQCCPYGATVFRVPHPEVRGCGETLGMEVGLELLPRRGAEVGVGRRGEDKLRAPRRVGKPLHSAQAGLAMLLCFCTSPHRYPTGRRRYRGSFSPLCLTVLLHCLRSHIGMGFPTVSSVRSARLKSGQDVLWAPARLVPRGPEKARLRRYQLQGGCYPPLPSILFPGDGAAAASWEGKVAGKCEIPDGP